MRGTQHEVISAEKKGNAYKKDNSTDLIKFSVIFMIKLIAKLLYLPISWNVECLFINNDRGRQFAVFISQFTSQGDVVEKINVNVRNFFSHKFAYE